MRRLLTVLVLLVASFSMVACGGKGGGGAADSRTAYEKLEAYPADLDTEVAKVMSPIDSVDGVITQLNEMPAKLGLSKEDFGKLIANSIAGKPFVAPGGVDAKAGEELKTFIESFKGIYDGIINAPENAKSLVVFVGESALNVPKWAASAIADAGVTKANPFASKEDKAKAEKQLKNLDTIKNLVMAKVQETQGKLTTLPTKAVEAATKFGAAMAEMGVASAGAAVDAAKDKAKVK